MTLFPPIPRSKPAYQRHFEEEQEWRNRGEDAINAEQERLLLEHLQKQARAHIPRSGKRQHVECGCLHPECKICGKRKAG